MRKIFVLALAIITLCTLTFILTGCSESPFVKALQNASDKTESITANFEGIEIVSDTADLTFVASDECKIEYTTHKKITYSTKVEDGTLKIKLEDSRRWFEKIFSFGDNSKLTVYLPAGEYSSLTINQDTGDIDLPEGFTFGELSIDRSTGDVKLSAHVAGHVKLHGSTGDTTVENTSCGSLDIKYSTGKITLTNVTSLGDITMEGTTGDMVLSNVSFKSLSTKADTGDLSANGLTGSGNLSIERSSGYMSIDGASCADLCITASTGKTTLSGVNCHSFTTKADTGDLTMTALIATGAISIERTTGDVYFGGCDAAEIYVETSTGDVKGTFLTAKIIQAKTNSGKINVPECWEGGKCRIETTTGKIEISIGH